MAPRRALVIGAGNMGVGIALDLARAGVAVKLTSRSGARRVSARKSIADLAAELTQALGLSLGWETTIEVVDEASSFEPDFIVEAIVEQAAAKRDLFKELEVRWLGVPIWSTTSAIRPSEMTGGLAKPDNVLVAHYANPAYLIPVVEIVPGPLTRPSVVTDCVAALTSWGKRPVVIRGEPPGFVFNRLQYAVVREAISLVSRGVISAEDLDAVVTEGYGLRLPVVGPLAMVDLSTLEVYARIAKLIVPDLARDEQLSVLDDMQAQDLSFLAWGPGEQAHRRMALRTELIRRAREREALTGAE